METKIRTLANEINISVSEDQLKKLEIYKSLLQEWNSKMNLTAITSDDEIVLKHFIDSMTVLKYFSPNSSIIDVGTGAGFPGMVLKIMHSSFNITLLDSLNKRIQFLNEVIQKTELNNVDTIHGRAEDFGCNVKFREKYDYAVARAVASLPVLAELCLPFVKVGGSFIAMKGSNLEEIAFGDKAIKILGGRIDRIDTFYLPDSDIERTIIVVKKVDYTPKEFPRKAGTPQKKPIIS